MIFKDGIIDLMEPDQEPTKSRMKIFVTLLIIFFICLISVSGYIYFRMNKIFASQQESNNSRQSNIASLRKIKGEETGDVNVLFMGLRGEGEQEADLTNGIMVINYDVATKKLNTISLSRDFYIPMTNGKFSKINSIYKKSKSEQINPITECQNAVSRTLGIRIDYTFMIDFKGFKQVIDKTGAIDVTIPQGANYPFLNTPEFIPLRDKLNLSIYHLNGDAALTFVKWPYNALPDYNRLERQQIFVSSAKKQILSIGTLLNPAKVETLITEAEKNVQTNFTSWELVRYLAIVADVKSENISEFNLTGEGAGALLVVSNYEGFTLSPKNRFDDFSQVQAWALSIVKN